MLVWGYTRTMDATALQQIASRLVTRGKGLIAADESTASCQKRFDAVGVPCTEESRREYRELIVTAPGLEEYVSGIIFYDETIRQRTREGKLFPEALVERDILPGIKVDAGTQEFASRAGEKITEGLDGLSERLTEYKTFGALFAKWRAVITIAQGIPTEACIGENARRMARYAALCQEAGVVPIVEPEVLIDGDHSLERCFEVSAATWRSLFAALDKEGVFLPGVILKASMVIAGTKAATQSSAAAVAEATVRCLTENVPQELAGVVFLSGGQGDEQATENLSAMNKLGSAPWPLTFSYSRAIQRPALQLWAADRTENREKAQAALLFRAKMCSLASRGAYSIEMEEGRPY